MPSPVEQKSSSARNLIFSVDSKDGQLEIVLKTIDHLTDGLFTLR